MIFVRFRASRRSTKPSKELHINTLTPIRSIASDVLQKFYCPGTPEDAGYIRGVWPYRRPARLRRYVRGPVRGSCDSRPKPTGRRICSGTAGLGHCLLSGVMHLLRTGPACFRTCATNADLAVGRCRDAGMCEYQRRHLQQPARRPPRAARRTAAVRSLRSTPWLSADCRLTWPQICSCGAGQK